LVRVRVRVRVRRGSLAQPLDVRDVLLVEGSLGELLGEVAQVVAEHDCGKHSGGAPLGG